MSKIMFKNVNVSPSELQNYSKKGFTLEYYITENNILLPDDNITIKTYGIEVRKHQKNGLEMVQTEMRAISDICCSYSEIVELVDILVRNTVTPTTVADVVEDLVGVIDVSSDLDEKKLA